MDDYGIVLYNFRIIVSSLGGTIAVTMLVLFVLHRLIFGEED